MSCRGDSMRNFHYRKSRYIQIISELIQNKLFYNFNHMLFSYNISFIDIKDKISFGLHNAHVLSIRYS